MERHWLCFADMFIKKKLNIIETITTAIFMMGAFFFKVLKRSSSN